MLSIVWRNSIRAGAWLPGRVSRTATAILLSLLFFAVVSPVRADDSRLDEIQNYINSDRVAEARALLSAIVATDYANAERLSLLAQLSPNCDSSYVRYFRSLELDPDPEDAARALVGMTSYALATDQRQLGFDLIRQYGNKAKGADSYVDLLLNWAQLAIGTQYEKEARGKLRDQLDEPGRAEDVARLLLAIGDIESDLGEYDDALDHYRSLANRSDHRYTGVALLRIADCYTKKGDTDNAHLTYLILSDRYPLTLGLTQFRNDSQNRASKQKQ
jgi:hypothetical protein